MNFQDFFNPDRVVDLSFFNFENAITACYYADKDLRVKKVNKNFKGFFPVLGNVKDAYFPDILKQLGVTDEQIQLFEDEIHNKGSVLIPKVKIIIDDKERLFSLLSTKTKNSDFEYLNGIQGQFVDRTNEHELTKQRDSLIEGQLKDKQIIEEKSKKLESLATRLAKYLSPQIYKNIFDTPPEFMCFQDIIQNHYETNKQEIYKDISKKQPDTIKLNLYRDLAGEKHVWYYHDEDVFIVSSVPVIIRKYLEIVSKLKLTPKIAIPASKRGKNISLYRCNLCLLVENPAFSN